MILRQNAYENGAWWLFISLVNLNSSSYTFHNDQEISLLLLLSSPHFVDRHREGEEGNYASRWERGEGEQQALE